MNFLNNIPVDSSVVSDALDSVAETVGNQGWGEMISEMINNADPMRFVDSLPYMGVGMLGIFIVIGVIILSVVVLNKLLAPKKTDE